MSPISRISLLFVVAGTSALLGGYYGYRAGFDEGVKTPEAFAAAYDWPETISDVRKSLDGMQAPEHARAVLLSRLREAVWRLGSQPVTAVGACSPADRITLRQAAVALRQDVVFQEPQLQAGLNFCEKPGPSSARNPE
jgi:hypothetical protein